MFHCSNYQQWSLKVSFKHHTCYQSTQSLHDNHKQKRGKVNPPNVNTCYFWKKTYRCTIHQHQEFDCWDTKWKPLSPSHSKSIFQNIQQEILINMIVTFSTSSLHNTFGPPAFVWPSKYSFPKGPNPGFASHNWRRSATPTLSHPKPPFNLFARTF